MHDSLRGFLRTGDGVVDVAIVRATVGVARIGLTGLIRASRQLRRRWRLEGGEVIDLGNRLKVLLVKRLMINASYLPGTGQIPFGWLLRNRVG